jgi:hypothetical protein
MIRGFSLFTNFRLIRLFNKQHLFIYYEDAQVRLHFLNSIKGAFFSEFC